LRTLLGILLALVARAWIATLRFRVHGADVLERDGARVLAFFHGTQMMMHGVALRDGARTRRGARRTVVMVSHSRDGEIQAAAMRALGFTVVRGSSSRGAARALASVVKKLREPRTDAAFAVDGPRGPYGVAKPGALACAKRARALVIPAGAAATRAWIARRAWDRFVLPRPFSRVEIVLGPPARDDDAAALSLAIAECNARAARLASRAPVVERAHA